MKSLSLALGPYSRSVRKKNKTKNTELVFVVFVVGLFVFTPGRPGN